MAQPSEQLQWLTRLFDALTEHQNKSASLEERTEVLRRMKILIDKIDGVVSSSEPDEHAKISRD